MSKTKGSRLSRIDWHVLLHSVRTSIGALASLWVARFVRMPEAYWAAITTLIIMLQPSPGAAFAVAGKRLAGTALGAFAGALVLMFLPDRALVFGTVVLALGLVNAALRLDTAAYRFASITAAIVMLIRLPQPAWLVATHRFVEVSVGIVVGLVLTVFWPEPSHSA